MFDYKNLKQIAEIEFFDIVNSSEIINNRKLRIYLNDTSYVDVFYSPLGYKKYFAFHWERTFIDNTIYRIDNVPDGQWKYVSTYPQHFHDGSYENVKESNLSGNPNEALREFLRFVRNKLESIKKVNVF